MVYCGKPSRGCQMCRTRRIKCDETKPTCKQCAKSNRQCPGYKDEFDIIFRNETKATERRAKKAEKKRGAFEPSVPSTAVQREGTAGREPVSPVTSEDALLSPFGKEVVKSPLELAIIPAIEIPLDTKATCHFVSNFILIPQQGSTRGFLDYLVPLLKREPNESHLQHAFNACSLASLGNRVGPAQTVDFREKATYEYTLALRRVSLALQHPEESKSDGLLAAVLMLGMFENITAQKMGDFAWGSHIEGAIQIVKARGKKQLRTKTGLGLFNGVRTQLIIHSLTSGTAPMMGADWWLHDVIKDETSAACQRINLHTAELRAELTQVMTTITRTPENVAFISSLLRRAQALDAQCLAWMKSIPEQWQYKTLCWEDNVPRGDYANAEVFPGRVDVYNDFWIASVWNMMRTARLILHSLAVRCAAWVCSPVDFRTTPEYATAARVCEEMITDIIASVPYHLGWHAKRRHLFANKDLSGFACGEDDCMKGLAGYFLTWPLACVNGQDYVTDRQRAWVVGRLRYIGDELGIKYAHILSQLHIRIPSMMIVRDSLVAQPSANYPMAHNFVKLISTSARDMTPTPGYTMNALQHRQTMQKEAQEAGKAELVAKASGGGGTEDAEDVHKVAKNWLKV